jgi:hypothetical protein
MKKLLLGMTAMMVMAVVAAPSASAQEAEKADAEKKMEKMEGEAKDVHWMKGTMTPPDQETMDISYKVTKSEKGVKGWIVAEADGEKREIPMNDIKWGDDYVSYSWGMPDNADLVISCNLMKQDDGGYAGDCTDNAEDGRTGQMTIAPMETKEKKDETAG